MTKPRGLLWAVVLLAIVVAGCGGDAGAVAAQLDGRTFLSTKITDKGADRALVPGTTIRLAFGKDGQLGVSAGCNLMGGSYRIDSETLSFEGGGMTEMGCDRARHDQDDWLFGFLGSRPTVTAVGNDLTLTSGDIVIRFLDREVADPDLPLAGVAWTVDSIITGDAVSSVPAGVIATLTFRADGRVDLATGCNQGGGTYAIEGDQIRFSDLVLTKRACDGPAGEMEAAVLTVLRSDPVTYRIEAASLSLLAGDRGLGLKGA